MIKTIELFAGVGGFRLGLEKNNTKKKENFKIIWSNQYEPSSVSQPASKIYEAWFGKKNHSSQDITKVIEEDFDSIPPHDLLVGGFPCQDYSVARSASSATGIKGKKGNLWWSIHHIILKHSTDYIMLENVDSLLKSPSEERGRDFAIILASLAELGYAVEWRIINAAEYGMPQRRKRVFIMAYKKGTEIHRKISELNDPKKPNDLFDWVSKDGVIQGAFPMVFDAKKMSSFIKIKGKLPEISENSLGFTPKSKPFANAGVMINGVVASAKGVANYDGKYTYLKDILVSEKKVPEEFFIPYEELDKWTYLKGSKKLIKTSRTGYKYPYAEGPVTFPDALDRASRTIITGEGGKSPSRYKHVVMTKSGRLRRLTPYELEKLNMFPGDLTKIIGVTDGKRAFFMGNALVVGVVERISKSLAESLD
jgi:DNA (cytosine-5)-methyltransferase 1